MTETEKGFRLIVSLPGVLAPLFVAMATSTGLIIGVAIMLSKLVLMGLMMGLMNRAAESLGHLRGASPTA